MTFQVLARKQAGAWEVFYASATLNDAFDVAWGQALADWRYTDIILAILPARHWQPDMPTPSLAGPGGSNANL